ncbi:hypothetical protein PRRG_00006 [Prochlorococcus phage P-RSP2]|jgi:hypothetical protein|nr:hypothetical protein PRRG_00006 [Prochlorococcus phage P-RSP2]
MRLQDSTDSAFVIKKLRALNNNTCPGLDRQLLIELEKTTLRYFHLKKASSMRLYK